MNIEALLSRWRARADLFASHKRDDLAYAYRTVVRELEEAEEAHEAELLTTAQAAYETGVSEETIRRWARSGKLTSTRNNGSRSRIYIKRMDLLGMVPSSTDGYLNGKDAERIARKAGW